MSSCILPGGASNTLMLASHARSCFVRKGPPYPSHTTHRNWRFPGSPSTSRLRPHGQVQSSALMIGNIILLPKIWWLLRFLQVIHKSQQRMFVVELHTQILTAGEYGVSVSLSLGASSGDYHRCFRTVGEAVELKPRLNALSVYQTKGRKSR